MTLPVQQLDEALAELSCRQVAVATVVTLSLIFKGRCVISSAVV